MTAITISMGVVTPSVGGVSESVTDNATASDSVAESVGGAYFPATPPATVAQWLIRDTDAGFGDTANFIGMHSDYVAGSTWPENPAQMMVGIKTLRSLDCDIERAYEPLLSWAACEPNADGVYIWTSWDKFVGEHVGKVIIVQLDRTPSLYAKYTTAYNLYGSYLNSSSPPLDPQKAVNWLNAIKARYPNQTFWWALHNEPNMAYANGAGGAITEANRFDVRWTDEFAEWLNPGNPAAAFYTGTPRDLAAMAKALHDANLRPVVGCSWEGQAVDASFNWIGSSFRRFSECPTVEVPAKTGAYYIDMRDVHSYTYDTDGTKMLAELQFYDTFALANGYAASLPKIMSECGFIGPSGGGTHWARDLTDSQMTDAIIRWAIICTGLRYSSCVYYKLSSGNGSQAAANFKYWDIADTGTKIASNQASTDAILAASVINGATIRQVAVLVDGRYWLETETGQQLIR